MNGERAAYLDAIARLSAIAAQSPDAVDIAEGWLCLPARVQRQVKLLIDDYIASCCPPLRDLYANSTPLDQRRFNVTIAAAQQRLRDPD